MFFILLKVFFIFLSGQQKKPFVIRAKKDIHIFKQN